MKCRKNFLGKSHRLQHWDYGKNGYYFITICTKNRENFFGKIENQIMILNEIGEIIKKYWEEIPQHFDNVVLDEFVIMPNHIHGIVIIENDEEVETRQSEIVETRHCLVSTEETIGQKRWQNQGTKTISSIIGSFKSICTKTINQKQNEIFFGWQPRFYDHIIRNEKSLENIRKYIVDNPLKWDLDENNIVKNV